MGSHKPTDPSLPQDQRSSADSALSIEHLVMCESCGQIYDRRDEQLVRHHGRDGHRPRLAPWSDGGE